MSRPLRIQYAGAVYHVMNRGNARQDIFGHTNHYQLFIRCMSEMINLWELKLHAFSLMPNHYHLLIETPMGNLSRAMRHLNHVYTQRFNRLTGRDGHLFRGRYKSILIEEDAYLIELLRYIHLNPVRAGMTKRPEQHRWTSHHYYLKGTETGFLTTTRLLEYFGRRRNLARRKLHEFVMSGVPIELEKRLSGQKWPSVLSSANFEEWVHWNFVKDLDDEQLEYVPNHNQQVAEESLQKILCQIFETNWPSLKKPQGHEQQKRRAQAIWFYRRYLKLGYNELSKIFGLVPSRISKIMSKNDMVSSELNEQVVLSLKK